MRNSIKIEARLESAEEDLFTVQASVYDHIIGAKKKNSTVLVFSNTSTYYLKS